MGFPLGPLLAPTFLSAALKIPRSLKARCSRCRWHIDAQVVDDTLTVMPDKALADNFLEILNQCHSSIKFTMETQSNRTTACFFAHPAAQQIETKVYVKPTNTGLLLYYKSNAISFPELRFPGPAVGKRELWENLFQACAIACHRCRLRLRSDPGNQIRLFAIVITKWMLPELSFSDRWSRGTKL